METDRHTDTQSTVTSHCACAPRVKIKEGTDIICVSEHWLWPYQITELSNVHQDFEGFGVADRRLNENSDHNRGCGGVGIIWNKSIQASPISNFKSDRFCAVKVSLSNGSSMSLISVYLPSTDHPLDEFEECLNELICVYSALQAEGPVVLLGDFNAHLNHPRNHQGSLLHDAIHRCRNDFFIGGAITARIRETAAHSLLIISNTEYIAFALRFLGGPWPPRPPLFLRLCYHSL